MAISLRTFGSLEGALPENRDQVLLGDTTTMELGDDVLVLVCRKFRAPLGVVSESFDIADEFLCVTGCHHDARAGLFKNVLDLSTDT